MRAQYLDKMDLERERGITIKAQAVRLLHERLRAEPDRHPGPRGLHVRGLAVARRLRGGGAARRRRAGARGADARELPPRARRRPRDRARARTRSTCPRPTPDQRADGARRAARTATRGHPARQREDRARASTELLEAVIAPRAAPGRRRRRAAAGADLRLDVRPVPRGDHLPPGQGGAAAQSSARSRCSRRTSTSEAEETGVIAPEATPVDALGPGEVGYLVTGLKDVHQAKVGDTITLAGKHGAARAAPRLPRAEADGVVGPVPGRGRRLLRRCARRSTG